MNSEPRHAVIIGASSGIGREMALHLAREGWRVTATGRREALLKELRAEAPDRIATEVFDVAEAENLPAHLDSLAAGRPIDVFVISAGTGFLNPELDPGPEQATVDVNVRAFTALADWAYRHFKAKGGGTLAAITSVGGMLGEDAAPAYSASKAYQINYLDGLRKRAAKEVPNLAVVEIRPGSVDTDMMKGEGHFWIGTPREAARTACRAVLGKKRLQYVTPRWALIGYLLGLVRLFR